MNCRGCIILTRAGIHYGAYPSGPCSNPQWDIPVNPVQKYELGPRLLSLATDMYVFTVRAGVAYAKTPDSLSAIDSAGNVLWSHSYPYWSYIPVSFPQNTLWYPLSGNVILSSNVIYTMHANTIYAYDTSSGSELWSWTADTWISWLILAYHRLIATDESGMIYCFN
jgi:outer membrane protein assembly factor BamB